MIRRVGISLGADRRIADHSRTLDPSITAAETDRGRRWRLQESVAEPPPAPLQAGRREAVTVELHAVRRQPRRCGCYAILEVNESIEEFPVGRRLAFDQAKSRLWVVCPRCCRWNLSPLEERWEAIEACERAYRETRLRAATENLGLASVGEGLELVRIGRPERPEMAAWRSGSIFARRR